MHQNWGARAAHSHSNLRRGVWGGWASCTPLWSTVASLHSAVLMFSVFTHCHLVAQKLTCWWEFRMTQSDFTGTLTSFSFYHSHGSRFMLLKHVLVQDKLRERVASALGHPSVFMPSLLPPGVTKTGVGFGVKWTEFKSLPLTTCMTLGNLLRSLKSKPCYL